jgi:hypothetical protein
MHDFIGLYHFEMIIQHLKILFLILKFFENFEILEIF